MPKMLAENNKNVRCILHSHFSHIMQRKEMSSWTLLWLGMKPGFITIFLSQQQQSLQLHHTDSPKIKLFKSLISAKKNYGFSFLEQKRYSPVWLHALRENNYCNTLRYLWQTIHNKKEECWHVVSACYILHASPVCCSIVGNVMFWIICHIPWILCPVDFLLFRNILMAKSLTIMIW